ncbi:MAG: hypothetical protein HY509_04875, partial [Acidobacteria bacterium]|nr:hypothetical protein [Acidobacteriota bacterium]
TVLYFSEGIDSPPGAVYLETAVRVGCGDSASAGNPAGFETIFGFDDLYGAANAANVTFHTVDARISELGTQSFLSGLAVHTGGVRGTASRAPAEALARVARQMATYYVLGHTLPSSRPDGAIHSIRVEVDRPGVEPRHRQKFADLGWRERENRSVLGAVALPELHRDLPLQGRAMPFRKGEKQFAVYFEVGLPVADLFWLPFRLEELGEVEFAGSITDARGRIEHEFRDVLEVKRDGGGTPRKESGLYYRGRADLGPGRYEMTAVAHDFGGGRIGATRFGFEVPEPAGGDFSLGGLVVGKIARGDLVVGAYSPYPEKRKSLPKKFRREVVVPLLADDLTTGDILLTYLEVFDPRKDERNPPLSLEVSVAFLRGGKVFARHRPIPMEANPEAGEEGGALSFAMVTPLQTFDPGPYDLRVEVADRAGNRRLVREIPLRILAAQVPSAASP